MRSVGNDRSRRGSDQSTGDRCARGAARDSADQGTCSAADQGAAEYMILSRSLTSGQRQAYYNDDGDDPPGHVIPPIAFQLA